MVKIAKDTPAELKKMLEKIDPAKINPQVLTNWLNIGRTYVGKYIFLRTAKTKSFDEITSIPDNYQSIFDFFNNYDFNLNPGGKPFNIITKKMYMGMITSWVRANMPMRG